MTNKEASQARAFIKALKKNHEKVLQDKRAGANYWNADDWGSMSGQRDAEAWIAKQTEKFVSNWIRRVVERKTLDAAQRLHSSTCGMISQDRRLNDAASGAAVSCADRAYKQFLKDPHGESTES